MGLTEKQVYRLAEFVAFLLINLLIFFISMLFVRLSVIECIGYSVLNATWMTFLLMPLLRWLPMTTKRVTYALDPLAEYYDKFRARQEQVRKEVQEEATTLTELHKTHRVDWKLFKKHMQKCSVKKLYHFTDEANLDSIIKRGGLFSWSQCDRSGISISRPGGNELSRNLDRRSGLENYVRLSFTPDHPMMYVAMSDGRISRPAVLEIEPDLVYLKESRFTDRNATQNGVNAGQSFSDFAKIRFNILLRKEYMSCSSEDKPYFQAEVLVKEHVPLGSITNIQKFRPMGAA